MPFTQEELDQLTPEVLNGDTLPDFLKPAVEKGLIIRTTKLDDAFKNSYKGSVITERDKELWGIVDATIEEASGIKKNAGEKATDFAKRAFTEATGELKDLREKKAAGTLTTAEKERITTLENALNTQKDGFEKERETFKSQMLDFRVSADYGAALNGIKGRLIKTLTGEALSDVMEAREAKFKKDFKPELQTVNGEETLVYRNVAKNEVEQNAKFNPASAAEILEGIFTAYLDKGTPPQPGGGSGKPNSANPNPPTEPATEDTYQMPADITTRVELTNDLKKKGILAGTTAFTKLLAKFGADLPLGR